MENKHRQRLIKIKSELDSVSPSFCIAKWKQVTMHLQNGMTHSCHHPIPHKIPIEEIRRNPTALHNTEFKKEQRKLMLEGKRPSECDYCWRVEDNASEDSLSDRIYKSGDSNWAYPHLQEVISKPWDENINPSYVEVSFGNVCNFKCSYCAPHISSQWMEEIEKYGEYPTSDYYNNLHWIKNENLMPIPNKDANPYVEAFWKWWPSMYQSLNHFRITGGEPLLNKNTFKVLDYIIENPNPNLELSINTNLNPPKDIFDKFLEKVKIIIDEKKVKGFTLFTSSEAHGKQSEYIRFGMNYTTWLENMHRVYKEIPNIPITIMSTYNLLSVPSYKTFLKDILDIKLEYGNHHNTVKPLLLDIPYLRHPFHQAIFIIEKDMIPMIYDQVTYMYQNLEYRGWMGTANRGFFEHEADKLKRIWEMAEAYVPDDFCTTSRKNLIAFVDEHDKRRGTNFLETFPEFDLTYNKWKNL